MPLHMAKSRRWVSRCTQRVMMPYLALRFRHTSRAPSLSVIQDTGSGDGDRDSSMVFVAQPSTVNHMLQQLTFECSKPDIEDVVTITIYDGEGGGSAPLPALPAALTEASCKSRIRERRVAMEQCGPHPLGRQRREGRAPGARVRRRRHDHLGVQRRAQQL